MGRVLSENVGGADFTLGHLRVPRQLYRNLVRDHMLLIIDTHLFMRTYLWIDPVRIPAGYAQSRRSECTGLGSLNSE